MGRVPAGPGERGRLAAGSAVALARLLLVVAAVLLGILGMHALTSSHLTAMDHTRHGTAQGTGTSQFEGGVVDAAALLAGAATGSGATARPPAVHPSGGAGHGAGTMMMLCVAMLTSVGALLLALVAWRGSSRLWARLRSWVCDTGPPALRIAGAGPPPVWEFSVVRC